MSDLDRLKKAFARLLEPLLFRLDYSCFYAATVVAQNGDGSLELKAAHPKLPNLSRVAIRYGIPGIAAKLNPGGRVIVGFENADPSAPFCLVWDAATIESVSWMGGSQPIARMGDAVSVFFPPAVPITGTVNGLPLVGVVTITNPAPGIITTGQKKVMA